MSVRIGLLLAVLVVAAHAQEATAPASGRIGGRVRWLAPYFAPREVLWPSGVRGHDLVLEDLIAGAPILDEELVVDQATRGIRDCVVYVVGFKKAATAPRVFLVDLERVALRPRASALPAGWVLGVRNRDPIGYDLELRTEGGEVEAAVHVAAGATVELGSPGPGRYDVRAVRFPFVGATVHATDGVPTVVTDPDGGFEVSGVPAGTVELEIHHRLLGRAQISVAVVAGETAKVDVTEDSFLNGLPDVESPFAGGKIVLEIDGIAVGQTALERLARFHGSRYGEFALPQSLRLRRAIAENLLPTAAMFGRHRARIPALIRRSRVVELLFRTGRTFESVARVFSEEESDARGDLLEPRTRDRFDPLLGEPVFAAAPGHLLGPLFTARGLHFLVVESVSVEEGRELRAVRHLLLKYDSDRTLAELAREAGELVNRARVTALEPALADYVPVENRR